MKTLILIGLLGILTLAAGSAFTDATGMVPGDVVVDNLTPDGPGHAGIYIGRWILLPQDLQDRYAKCLAEADVRSGSVQLLDSYLVVDCMPGRGVRVTPFVEQFTNYHGGTNARYPNLTKYDMAGAMQWENNIGVAVRWPDLGDNSQARWSIVEKALQCAYDHVQYDETHLQMSTTTLGEIYRSARGKPLTVDCISLCHWVYWAGAQQDLDVSWAPYQSPQQLYDYAMDEHLARATGFRPVLCDAAYLGEWKPVKVSFDTAGLSDEQVEALKSGIGYFPDDMTFEVRREGSKSEYTLYECSDHKRNDSPPTPVVLDVTVHNPIGVGKATSAVSGSGAGGKVTFMPQSADWAAFVLEMQSGDHSVVITVSLSRVRTPRPVIR